MSPRGFGLLVLALFAIHPPVLVPRPAWGPAASPQDPARPPADAQARARALVARAMDGLGGAPALRAASRLRLDERGTLDQTAQFQGWTPGEPSVVALTETLAIDDAGGRVAYESRHTRIDGVEEWLRYAFGAGDRVRFAHRVDAFGVEYTDPAAPDTRQRLRRRVPHHLLAELGEEAAGARWLDRAAEDGRTVDRVGARLGGQPVTVSFDVETGRLLGFAFLADVPLAGDAEVRWRYHGDRDAGPLGRLPEGYTVSVAGRLLRDMRWEVARPLEAADAPLFDVPDGIVPRIVPPAAASSPPAPADPEVLRRAPGVYSLNTIRGGFHGLAVEFADHVVIVDAPTGWLEFQYVPAQEFAPGATSSSLSEAVLRAVRTAIPDKPVRYVVLTHHHGDHAGGVRAFLAAGATVVGPPPIRAVVERALTRPHTLSPDPLEGRPVTPRVEIVDGVREMTDDTQRLRLVDVGSNPHSSHMLVAHLPAHDLLFVADLFFTTRLETFPPRAERPLLRFFVRWLDGRGLAPATILTAHGSVPGTPEHLARVRALDGADVRGGRR